MNNSINDMNNDQFLKIIGNISSFQTITQIQQFMSQLVIDLQVNQDLNVIHNILFIMLSAAKHLLSTKQLQGMLNSSQYIASLKYNNSNNNLSLSPFPSPSPMVTPSKLLKPHIPPMTPLLLSNRSNSLPLQLCLKQDIDKNKKCAKMDIEYIKIKPVTNILELPDHILSYCCSYLATKDLLLSADLCCNRLCQIARMPSSFHGKFIFGSAIHSEYHKLQSNNNNFDEDDLMLNRFHHSKEIHFINIFNYDTIQLLKTCNFPKIESIYLYDRFNHLIEYLPSLIPNVSKLYITTNGGNETLDIIQANTNYYCDQLCTLFNGYSKSIKSVYLKHNTFYDIPLMLPEDAAKLLLNEMKNLNHLSLKNVYFPPDLNEYQHVDDIGYDTDYSGSFVVEEKYDDDNNNNNSDYHSNHSYHSVKHLELIPYNEYCADHFDSSLKSLSLHWNVVGQNNIFDMVKLTNLNKLHLALKLDNDSLDYYSLKQFIIQSECLLSIKSLEIDIDLNDAVWSSFEKILEISSTIFNIMVNKNDNNNNMDILSLLNCYNKTKYIKINIIDICNSTSYSHMFGIILPQIIQNMLNNIINLNNNHRKWDIMINIKHPIPNDCDNDYYNCCMNNAIKEIETNCSALFNHHSHNTTLKFVVSNETMFELQTISSTNSIFL